MLTANLTMISMHATIEYLAIMQDSLTLSVHRVSTDAIQFSVCHVTWVDVMQFHCLSTSHESFLHCNWLVTFHLGTSSGTDRWCRWFAWKAYRIQACRYKLDAVCYNKVSGLQGRELSFCTDSTGTQNARETGTRFRLNDPTGAHGSGTITRSDWLKCKLRWTPSLLSFRVLPVSNNITLYSLTRQIYALFCHYIARTVREIKSVSQVAVNLDINCCYFMVWKTISLSLGVLALVQRISNHCPGFPHSCGLSV